MPYYGTPCIPLQRPAGLVEAGLRTIRWGPILDVADQHGVDIAWEAHPGEDVHDGVTFEMMLKALENHPRANLLYDPSHLVLQGMDYVQFIEIYHERIKAFHVKDANSALAAALCLWWLSKLAAACRSLRSLGDGQIDFPAIFSSLTQHGL